MFLTNKNIVDGCPQYKVYSPHFLPCCSCGLMRMCRRLSETKSQKDRESGDRGDRMQHSWAFFFPKMKRKLLVWVARTSNSQLGPVVANG